MKTEIVSYNSLVSFTECIRMVEREKTNNSLEA